MSRMTKEFTIIKSQGFAISVMLIILSIATIIMNWFNLAANPSNVSMAIAIGTLVYGFILLPTTFKFVNVVVSNEKKSKMEL